MKYKKTNLFLCLFLFLTLPFFIVLKKSYENSSVTEIHNYPSKDRLILIDGVIEGKIYSFELTLGRYPLFLDKAIIDKIKKIEKEPVSWKSVHGEDRSARAYTVPEVVFSKKLKWENIVALENLNKATENRIYGSIGRGLLEKTNLFFDLANNKIYACNSLSVLQKKEIAPKTFLKTPIVIISDMMGINVDTNLGPLNLVLSTGSEIMLLDKPFVKDKKPEGFFSLPGPFFDLPAFSTKQFIIENKDFGKTYFTFTTLDKDVIPFDGFLGLDFFEKHAIYIDYKNKFLYIGDSVNKIAE